MPDSELDFPFEVPAPRRGRTDDPATDVAATAESGVADDSVTDESVTDASAGVAEATVEAPAEPIDADDVLLASVDLARAALLQDTPADTVGEPAGHIVEGEHVLSLLFECTMPGYPGWNWTVTLSRIDANSAPTVLETELKPGEYALLAPDWVPWSERLSDYRAAQELASAQAATESLDTDDDEELDDDDTDDDDTDEFGDDDHGDDALDGIDFETAADGLLNPADFGETLTASELHPGEAGDAEPDTEDGAPEPPAESGSGEGLGEDDDKHEGDKPGH